MTKKVSRNKRDNKTKRRTRAGTRSHGSRRTRNRSTPVKRGGMHVVRRSIQNTAREYFYSTVLPLLQTYDNHVAGYNPHPSDGSVVKYGERYYRTFADIPIDAGIKATINNLKRELKDIEDPVKNFDKIKSAYDKVISKLEEEKRQQYKENGGNPKPITASTFSSSPFSSVSPFSLQQEGDQRTQRVVDSLSKIMSQPFGTPNTVRYPDYSSGSVTPAKPRPKGTIGGVVDDDDDDDRTAQVLFGVESPQPSPMRSPPPPSSSNPSGQENKEKELFSPVRNLRF